MRLFIAVDLSEEAKKEIEKLYKFLKRKHWTVKWEQVNKLHITLAFLNDLKANGGFDGKIKNSKFAPSPKLWSVGDKIQNCNLKFKIKKIKTNIEKATEKISPFKISFKGLGCFPDFEWPRIIWLGVKGDLKSLAALQKGIGENLIEAGFSIKPKPFSPHVTLGRIKKARGRQRREIGRQIRALRKMDFKSEVLVDEVRVYQSTCLPEGSIYKKLFEVQF